MSLDIPERGDGDDERGGRGRSDWAYDMLHEAIREGTLEPGQRVMEPEVSAWLRISRTPVREAMRRMQAEGLLEHAPGGGLSVALYDLRAIGEFYATRESLEGTAAALAARNADDTERRILASTLDAMRKLPDDPRAHARENQALHEQIYQAAHNRFLLKSLRTLLNFVPLLGRTTYHAPGRAEVALREHEAIVAAIQARDPAEAEAAARLHIRHAYESRVHVVTEDIRAAAERRSARRPSPGPGERGSVRRPPAKDGS
ncbi:GntR family transcriptional regulator [Plastoroseomonas hellenica]|uniref:GntR family transcriptional regulator n=1 Tax=Plastoroseomonas hellenica TaxID=2687306 RepID=UPI001BA7EE6F|nr:GntR family transcriptional regulator [Plastoroseomonas hellenica]MBR0642018.1 GntR family transcriptional regulator [Plastoroseomonas hellenica]